MNEIKDKAIIMKCPRCAMANLTRVPPEMRKVWGNLYQCDICGYVDAESSSQTSDDKKPSSKTKENELTELKKEFEEKFADGNDVEKVSYIRSANVSAIWNFFAPHLISSQHDEVKREAVWDFNVWLKRYTENDRALFESTWKQFLTQQSSDKRSK